MFRLLIAVLLLLVPTLAAAQSFPVAIKHALGETVIPAAPARIVTWGSSGQEAVLALGQVPVGMPTARSEGFDKDIAPWVEEAIAGLGGETPKVFDAAANPPIEQIAALKPDLILATYSGITQDEYTLLNAIAPTVAYPDKPWTTSWQDVIAITGTAMGKADEAKTIIADLETFIAEEGAKRPHIEGTTFVTLLDYNNALAIHSAADARVKMLQNAGMVPAEKPATAGPSEAFWYPLSYEYFDQIPADVVIPFFSTRAASDAFLAKPYVSLGPWLEQGTMVMMNERVLNMSILPGNALSLRWGLPAYLDRIETAAAKAKE
jgi:iron complex transport system substrate-binding protein